MTGRSTPFASSVTAAILSSIFRRSALLTLAAHPERPCDQRMQSLTITSIRSNSNHHLQSLRRELKRMIRKCGGEIATCRVIEALADHAHARASTRAASIVRSINAGSRAVSLAFPSSDNTPENSG